MKKAVLSREGGSTVLGLEESRRTSYAGSLAGGMIVPVSLEGGRIFVFAPGQCDGNVSVNLKGAAYVVHDIIICVGGNRLQAGGRENRDLSEKNEGKNSVVLEI